MEQSNKTIAVLQIITAAGLALFWLGFFTVGLAPENPPQGYFQYEHSFPLPDIILAVALLAAGIMLLKGRPAGVTLSLVTAGSLMFLGVLDFSFNIQNGMYAISALDLVLNAFINLWCVAFGLAVIRWLKRA